MRTAQIGEIPAFMVNELPITREGVMRRVIYTGIGIVGLSLLSGPASAGCGSEVQQCMIISPVLETVYDGLCSVTQCANVDSYFWTILSSDGTELQLTFASGGQNIEPPLINGIPFEYSSSHEGEVVTLLTAGGELFILGACKTDCSDVDPESIGQ